MGTHFLKSYVFYYGCMSRSVRPQVGQGGAVTCLIRQIRQSEIHGSMRQKASVLCRGMSQRGVPGSTASASAAARRTASLPSAARTRSGGTSRSRWRSRSAPHAPSVAPRERRHAVATRTCASPDQATSRSAYRNHVLNRNA